MPDHNGVIAADPDGVDTPRLLSPDQKRALARLERLLERRCAVDAQMRNGIRPPAPLIHALDWAIVSVFQQVQQLGLPDAARQTVHSYRLGGARCQQLLQPVLAAR
jgi:hypothetical protein